MLPILKPKPSGLTCRRSAKLQHLKIKPQLKEFIEFVAIKSRVKSYAFFSNAYVAREFGVDERTIRRWLAIAREAELIHVAEMGHRRIYVCPSILEAYVLGEETPTFEDFIKGKEYHFFDLRGVEPKQKAACRRERATQNRRAVKRQRRRTPAWKKAAAVGKKFKAARTAVVFDDNALRGDELIFADRLGADKNVRHNTSSSLKRSKYPTPAGAGKCVEADASISCFSSRSTSTKGFARGDDNARVNLTQTLGVWDVISYESEAERDEVHNLLNSREKWKACALVGQGNSRGSQFTLREDLAILLEGRLAASHVASRNDPDDSIPTARAAQWCAEDPDTRLFVETVVGAELEDLPSDGRFYRMMARSGARGDFSEEAPIIRAFAQTLRGDSMSRWALRYELPKLWKKYLSSPGCAVERAFLNPM